MKTDVLLGILVGMMAGGLLVTYYKPAQKIIKKGSELVKDEAKEMMSKAKTSN